MILIEPYRAGSMWLRAMLRFYCSEHDCKLKRASKAVWYADGLGSVKAEYAYEIAHGRLQIAIINALACADSRDVRKIITKTTRDFVKGLYNERAIQASR